MIYLFFLFRFTLQFYLPFERNYQDADNYLSALLKNYISTTLCFGEPHKQCLQLNIETKEYSTWLLSSKSNHLENQKFYKQSQSESFYLTDTSQFQFSFTKYRTVHLSCDTLFINDDITIKEFSFLLCENFSEKDLPINSGVIGLGVQSTRPEVTNGINLIGQLRKKRFISSYSFAFIYEENNSKFIQKYEKGKLIIGEYPHEYINCKGFKLIYETTTTVSLSNLLWGVTFDSVLYGEEMLTKDSTAYIAIEFGFILGPEEYQNKTDEQFFNAQIDKGKCKKEIVEEFVIYTCDTNTNIKSFPDLVFKKRNYNITLTKNDLFSIKDNRMIFMVIFPVYFNMFFGSDWRLGMPFLYSIPTVFDIDKKQIGFYIDSHLVDKTIIEIMTVILKYLIIILIVIGVLFGISILVIKWRRKARKNIYYTAMKQ